MPFSLFYRKIILSFIIAVLIFFGSGGYLDMFNVLNHPYLKMVTVITTFLVATYLSFSIKYLKYFHLLMLFIILFYAYIGINYGSPNTSLLVSLLETNRQESIECFVNANWWLFSLPIALLISIILFIKMPIILSLKKGMKATFKKLATCVVYILLMYTCFQYPDYGLLRKAKYTFQDYIVYKSIINHPKNYHFAVAHKNNHKKKKFSVVIIGESVRKDYLSLYGYPIHTTPFLDKVNGTFFTHYLSAGPNTAVSLQLSLTLNNADFTSPVSQNIINLAKSGGYKTYWISNQGAAGTHDTLISKIAHSSDQVDFFKLGRFDSSNQDDFEMLTKLDNLIKNAKKDDNELIFMHMMGSHPYPCSRLNRFPRTFFLFESEAVNCYLDTILKLDTFISKTKSILDRTQENYSIIYFSDHGMDVSNAGVIVSPLYKQNYAVPLLIIDSDAEQRTFINEYISAVNFPSIFAYWLGLDVSKVNNIKNINHYEALGEKNIKVFNWSHFVDYHSLKEQPALN